MSWVKLDDGFPDHPKILAAGALAGFLWACGLAYCNRQKQRIGVIPASKVAVLFPLPNPMKLAAKLVAVGLWERIDGGFRVHDYHEYQPDQITAEELSRKRADVGRLGGQKSAAARRRPTDVGGKAGKAREANEAKPTFASSKKEANCFKQNRLLLEAKTNPVPVPVKTDTAESDDSARNLLPRDAFFAADAAERTTARPREAPNEPIDDEILTAAHRKFPHLQGREQVVAWAWSEAKGGGPPRNLHVLDGLTHVPLPKILAHLAQFLTLPALYRGGLEKFVETFNDHDPDTPPSQEAPIRGARGQPLSGSMANLRKVAARVAGGVT